MENKFKFVVKTRDVDHSASKTYKSFAGARKRFEEMYGHSMESALLEMGLCCDAEKARFVRGVSDYGTVVCYERKEVYA